MMMTMKQENEWNRAIGAVKVFWGLRERERERMRGSGWVVEILKECSTE